MRRWKEAGEIVDTLDTEGVRQRVAEKCCSVNGDSSEKVRLKETV